MQRTLITMSLAVALFASGCVHAGPHRHHHRDSHGHEDWAKVTHVEPVYERVSYPEKHCWTERVHGGKHHHKRDQHTSYVPVVTGALVGGVVGNQFGRGKGKDAMTVGGVLLGAAVGHDLSRGGHHGYRDHRPRVVERCEYRDNYREELVGYRVSYRYHGERYTTRTDYHPGDRIKVHAEVRPKRHR